MRRVFGLVLRWSIVPVLLFLGITTGGADGIVGWFVLAWLVFRGGPGMWADVRRFFGFMRGRSVAGLLRRRGAAAGGELNA